MFRQEEVFLGGWQEKTIESMQKRRFEQMVAHLPPLGAGRLSELSPSAFSRKLEQCWQDIERKPMRAQQIGEVWKSVLKSMDAQTDSLSHEEHELVERALILGGSAQLEDAAELEAARALSLRLWANVGTVSGRPFMELETPVLEPAARAIARPEHERIRRRLEAFCAQLTGMIYRAGALDDRQPQRMLIQEVFTEMKDNELSMQLARRYLWASFDCIDYSGGVMLVHQALADPRHLIAGRQKRSMCLSGCDAFPAQFDILPEEIPLQLDLERAIAGALRDEYRAEDAARNIRFLCKQGAPVSAMKDVLQSMLIVLVSDRMRSAIENMYRNIPKWIESSEQTGIH